MNACLGRSHPIARKPHRCDYCGEAIPRGQRYRRWCCIQDGAVSSVLAHIACDDIAQNDWDARDGVYDDERWVCADTILEWPSGQIDPRASLAAMAARESWPDGEETRLARFMGLDDHAQAASPETAEAASLGADYKAGL